MLFPRTNMSNTNNYSLWYLKYQRNKACHVMLLFPIHTITSAYAYQQHWNKQKENKRSYKYTPRNRVEWE